MFPKWAQVEIVMLAAAEALTEEIEAQVETASLT
jgi:hypothetical protein